MEDVAVWYIHVNSSARTCVACASVQYAAQVVVCCHVCVGLFLPGLWQTSLHDLCTAMPFSGL